MSRFRVFNRMVFYINRILFAVSLFAYALTTAIGSDLYHRVAGAAVDVTTLLLGAAALLCFVEYFILKDDSEREPIKLFYYQFAGLLVLLVMTYLISFAN